MIESKSYSSDTSTHLFQDNVLYDPVLPQDELSTSLEQGSQFEDPEKSEEPSNKCKVSVFDVAAYILFWYNEQMSTMKLHKLLYYCQAWSLVWDEKPLFYEDIEAWANGPVVRTLFNYHKGLFNLSFKKFDRGNVNILSDAQKETIKVVMDFYGKKDSQWLIDQTHMEIPWQNARKGLKQYDRGSVVISLESMQEYYSSLIQHEE